MSKEALERIEKTLSEIRVGQDEICRRIAALEAGSATAPGGGPGREELLAYLDQFRAGEALGEASTGAWIAASKTECLRGGLRTVQMREGCHARLLEERIKELGGSPSFELPQALHDAVMQQVGADKADAEKLKDFVAQFPDIDKTLERLHEMADRLDADPETQSLLRTIAQDERATLEFLHEACALLNPSS